MPRESANGFHIDPRLARRRRMSGENSTDASAMFLQHRDVLKGVAMKLCANAADANDLVQDTFERALRVPSNESPDNVRSWLITVMHNLFLDQCRHQTRGPRLVPIEEETDLPEPDPEVEPEWAAISPAQLEAALAQLDDRFREVYELHCLQGASYEEIARSLNITKTTVGTRLARAREKIRELLRAQLSGSVHSKQDYGHAV
jgi:RNA polymerase sigma-70 factor (ECF subfamily)